MNKLMKLLDKAEGLLGDLIHGDWLSEGSKERIVLRLKVMISIIEGK